MDSEEVTISVAGRDDARDILALIHDAFRPVAAEYGLPTLPPLEETLDEMTALFDTHVVLKACTGGRIVGSVRGVQTGITCEVGRLVVAPDAQGHGIGTALARALEDAFPAAERFEIFTGHRPSPSLHIYRSLGYTPFRTERVAPSLELVYLEKQNVR